MKNPKLKITITKFQNFYPFYPLYLQTQYLRKKNREIGFKDQRQLQIPIPMTKEKFPRIGGWIQTYSGQAFWPLDPRPEEIHIQDIAHALSLISRYCGHCRVFYPVAQHVVLVAHTVPRPLALEGLMHDASEAYISDIPTPVKACLPDYQRTEVILEETIAKKYNLIWPWPTEVKLADHIIFKTECRDILPHPLNVDAFISEDVPILDNKIIPWSSDKAEFMFQLHFDYLQNHEDISELKKYVFN